MIWIIGLAWTIMLVIVIVFTVRVIRKQRKNNARRKPGIVLYSIFDLRRKDVF